MAQGLFAKAFIEKLPLIPVEEEGRLNDFKIRENFIVRVFSYHRLQNLFQEGFSRGALVNFHTRHKFLLLSHNRKLYDALGRLVADAKKVKPRELRARYSELFMEALAFRSTAKKKHRCTETHSGVFKKESDKRRKEGHSI